MPSSGHERDPRVLHAQVGEDDAVHPSLAPPVAQHLHRGVDVRDDAQQQGQPLAGRTLSIPAMNRM